VAWNNPVASGTYTRIEGMQDLLSILYATKYIYDNKAILVLRMEDMERTRSEFGGMGQMNKNK
jgi:hypothetical protein